MIRALRLPAGAVPQYLLALVAGAIAVPSFAPFNVWPLALISLFVLFLLWRETVTNKRAFAIGFAWGLGLFLVGVSWIFVSLHEYGHMPVVLAALATLLFAMYLSLYPALAGLLQHWLARRFAVTPVWRLAALIPASFVLFEHARGWVVTGFPWLTFGYSQAPDGWLIGFAPIVGVHGISLLLAVSAGVALLFVSSEKNRAQFALAVAIALLWLGAVFLNTIEWSEPAGKPVRAALLQGNVSQHVKWREDERARIFADYASLIHETNAQLVVLPESALPDLLERIPADYIDAVKRDGVARNFDAIVGVPLSSRADSNAPFTYSNSAISLGASATQRYDKQHLVAFGEFIPPLFSWVFQWLKIPMGDFTSGGDQQKPMAVAGQKVAVNICYEDAFGREIVRQLPEATLLANISDMSWFGQSLAPHQHAQFSQMRAIETGRWMLRATNTGATMAIDERGHIVKTIPHFARGVLEVDAVPRNGTTPYVRVKDWVALGAIVGLVLAAMFFGGRRQKT